ncbi:MAG: SpoIIE family protein phosphatase [FCB group bacterium]|nr:SpoIIE family protein phosphatase [FCB group bacterium]
MSTQQLIFTLFYFAFGAGLIYLAVLIIRDSARIRLNRVTSAMLFLAGLGPIFIALGTVISPYQAASPFKESFLYNLFYIWELFFPVLVYFSWIFPYDRLATRRSRWRYMVAVPHLFHIILVIFFSDTDRVLEFLTIESGDGGLFNSILEPITSLMKWMMIPVSLLLASHKKLFSLVNLVYVLVAVGYLYRGMRLVEAPRLRKQVRVILLGTHFALGLYVFTFILPNLVPLEISETLSSLLTVLALVMGAGSIAYSIIRYQFLDIRLIIRQSLVYTVSSALLVGIYIIAITRLSSMLEKFVGQEIPLLNIGFIVVALIFFQPINNQIDNFIKRMFLKDKADYRNIMNRLSSQIISILDRQQLFRLVEDTLKGSMQVEGVGFAIYDDALSSYIYFPDSEAESTNLSNTDSLLGAIGQLNLPTFFDQIETWHLGSPLATLLQVNNTHMVVPLRDREHLLGFITLTDKITGFKFSFEDKTVLSTLANQLVVALSNVRFYRESVVKQRLEEEMNLARQIQLNLLPENPPHGTGYSFEAHSRPSRTVGGDFYDFVDTGEDGKMALVIADVSGKGMPAAMLAAQIQAVLRTEVCNCRVVPETVTNVNNIVSGLSSSSGKYATLFYGVFHPESFEFEFSNAGHNYPILMRADGSYELLETGGTIVGAFKNNEYQSQKVQLRPDDLLFFYTDGLSEAHDKNEDEFGEDRIIDFLRENRHKTPAYIKDTILGQVEDFTVADTPEDDTTLIILKIQSREVV